MRTSRRAGAHRGGWGDLTYLVDHRQVSWLARDCLLDCGCDSGVGTSVSSMNAWWCDAGTNAGALWAVTSSITMVSTTQRMNE
eukprot:COSAG02_NODE_15203_length_1190_cov_0.848402_1_plen_83_part_00